MFWNFKRFKFVKTTKQVISDGSVILDIKWYSGSFHPSELEDIVPDDINEKVDTDIESDDSAEDSDSENDI